MVSVSGWRPPRWNWKLVAVAFLLLPLGTCGACYAYGQWWWAGAEAAVRQTVASKAGGRIPSGVDARVDSGEVLRPSIDFRQAYAITGADNFLAGTSVADLVSPGVWVAHLEFVNGHVYHAEARRWQGHWVVTIEPANDL